MSVRLFPHSERIKRDDLAIASDLIFNSMADTRKRASEIRADATLSDLGKRGKLRELAEGPARKFLDSQREAVKAERAKLAERKKHFEIFAPKRGDAVDELQRQERRAYLRSLKNPGERLKLVCEDLDFANAACFSPAPLSGLDDDMMQRGRDFLQQHQYAGELSQLAEEETDINELEAAIEIAESSVAREIDATEERK